MNMQKLVDEIINSGYTFIGIRHVSNDESYQKGDCCRNSYDWDYVVDCSTYDGMSRKRFKRNSKRHLGNPAYILEKRSLSEGTEWNTEMTKMNS